MLLPMDNHYHLLLETLIRQAHLPHGYALKKKIAAHLGLHYSTVSKAFAKAEQEN